MPDYPKFVLKLPYDGEGIQCRNDSSKKDDEDTDDGPSREGVFCVCFSDVFQCIGHHGDCESKNSPNQKDRRQTQEHCVPVKA